jgi:plasmid stabilization system protein ParE
MDKALSLFNDHRHFWLLARLGYSEQALADREGLTDFLIETDPSSVVEAVGLIEEAVALRVRHPLIGRPVEFGRHALLISRGRTGYLAF